MLDTLTVFYITIVLMGLSFGSGFYIGERGLAGVKIDLNNTKNDLEKVKNAIFPQTAIVTPVANPKASDTVTVTATPSI